MVDVGNLEESDRVTPVPQDSSGPRVLAPRHLLDLLDGGPGGEASAGEALGPDGAVEGINFQAPHLPAPRGYDEDSVTLISSISEGSTPGSASNVIPLRLSFG